MQKFKPIFLRIYFSLVVTFFLKLWLSVCTLLNMFQLDFNTILASLVFILRKKLWKIVMKSQFVMFLTFFLFFWKIKFLRLWLIMSSYSDPINPIFVVVLWIYKIQVFEEVFFLLATIAMTNEKLQFFQFPWQPSLEKWIPS